MEVLKKIEEVLNVKIEKIEEMKGKSFPLFDMITNMQGMKLALIKDPVFVVIESEDVYEKKLEGNFIITEVDGKYIVAKYIGEPNIDALRNSPEEPEEDKAEPEEKEVEAQGGEDGVIDEEGGEDGKEQESGDLIKEILEKMPTWANGVVVIKKNGGDVAVLPIKKSTKKENAYYSSVTWKPLSVSGVENLINHVITKDGKAIKSNVYIGDKYINIFTRFSNRPRGRSGYYSGRR
jgi:hypothetical protein